jgi:hypothetical protein
MSTNDASAPPGSPSAASPEQMRHAMADYVRAVHAAYLDAVAVLPPAERARLPLVDAPEFTVCAIGTRNLHVLATVESLPAPAGQEVEITDSTGNLVWRLRFFDPVIVPALGLVDESAEPQPGRIREVLGIRTVLYHLTVPPGGGLTAHHALHAGTGLAHSHAAAARDLDSIAALAADRPGLVADLRGATVAGLPYAQLLLASALAPNGSHVHATADATPRNSSPDPVAVRRALLADLRGEGS